MIKTTDDNHPAIQANIQSTQLAAQGDKQAWLALYADDAVLKDPVGTSPLESTGAGHKGKQAIEAFWDMIIGPANIQIEVTQRIISGPKNCAVLQKVTNTMANGKTTQVDMIATYEVNEAGLIIEMCAYWDFDELMAQMS
ncbi:MAG: nuclear transport factor 2 family protein [Pseudomonadales bacterium]|nr:nuclear transport factor 2 family protein [Pseudomonadales bacterium]